MLNSVVITKLCCNQIKLIYNKSYLVIIELLLHNYIYIYIYILYLLIIFYILLYNKPLLFLKVFLLKM